MSVKVQRSGAEGSGAERSAGMTLLETVMVAAVVAFLSVVTTQLLRGFSAMQSFTEGQTKTLSNVERVMQRVVRDVEFSTRVYYQSLESATLLSMLNMGDVEPVQGSRFPVVTRRGFFDVDPADNPETGNSLLCARVLSTRRLDVLDQLGETVSVRVDLYRFVHYYVAEVDSAIDLQRWASRPVARYGDIRSIEDQDIRSAVIVALWQSGVHHAWDRESPIALAFYGLSAEGHMAHMTQSVSLPDDPEQVENHIFRTRKLALANNRDNVPVQVPRYARPERSYPGGFEIKVDGTGAGQLVLIRMVVATPVSALTSEFERRNFAEVVRLVSIKDT